jgi:hypothetical protein
LKACKHFACAYGDETIIAPSNGYPWNGWLEVYEGSRLIYSSFQAGLRWDYLRHLQENPECRGDMDERSIQEQLKEIEEEWEAVTN